MLQTRAMVVPAGLHSREPLVRSEFSATAEGPVHPEAVHVSRVVRRDRHNRSDIVVALRPEPQP